MCKKLFSTIEFGSVREKKTWIATFLIMLAVLGIDLGSKFAVVNNFKLYESREVIPDFFSLTYVTNPGAAWGMLAGKQYFLLGISLIVFIGCIIFLRKLTEGFVERYWAIGLLFGGMFGNSFDRLYHGEVIDFFDCYVVINNQAHHWPIFNVADIAICVGVGIFILSSLLRQSKQEKSE
ncbi:MAG: signal peptidase II [Lentisphaeria bacterium]|nr:signal peptidase II [Lentisphaeria bacterium]